MQVSEPGTQTPPGSQSSADVQQALLRCFVPYGRVVSFVWACIRRIVPAVHCTSAVPMLRSKQPTIATERMIQDLPSVIAETTACCLANMILISGSIVQRGLKAGKH